MGTQPQAEDLCGCHFTRTLREDGDEGFSGKATVLAESGQ